MKNSSVSRNDGYCLILGNFAVNFHVVVEIVINEIVFGRHIFYGQGFTNSPVNCIHGDSGFVIHELGKARCLQSDERCCNLQPL